MNEEEKGLMVLDEPRTDLQIAREPEIVLSEARKAAHALNDVIKNKKKPVIFNGEQYLEFEDWQTVGRFYGVTAKIVSTEFVDFGAAQGFLARAVALRPDGMEISAAEAMCLNDEPNWSKKPLFQLRSMAQTRACGKSLRNVLAWVVVLAGYKATPAEEIQDMAQGQKAPITKPQAKQEAAKEQGEEIITGVDQVTMKSGEKNGKPWTLYTVHAGEKYSTFSETLAKEAKRAHEAGLQVKLTYEQTDKGRNLKTLEVIEPREPGSEG